MEFANQMYTCIADSKGSQNYHFGKHAKYSSSRGGGETAWGTSWRELTNLQGSVRRISSIPLILPSGEEFLKRLDALLYKDKGRLKRAEL